MDKYLNANAVLSVFSKKYMELKRGLPIRPTEKAVELVESAKIDLKRQLDCLIDGMGQEKFDTLVRLAGIANSILDNEGE